MSLNLSTNVDSSMCKKQISHFFWVQGLDADPVKNELFEKRKEKIYNYGGTFFCGGRGREGRGEGRATIPQETGQLKKNFEKKLHLMRCLTDIAT